MAELNDPKYPYEDDRFDLEADEVGAHGGHRAEDPFIKRNLGSLLTLLIALAILVAAIAIINMLGSSNQPGAAPQVSVSDAGGDENTAEDEQATTETQTGEESEPPAAEPLPEANLASPVLVLNGAGIPGLAGQWAQALASEGWTSLDVGNVQRTDTPGVYYRNAEDAATANQLASYLGVEASQSEQFQSPIVVVVIEAPNF